jgi:sugar phosphate isomerase/epimerase
MQAIDGFGAQLDTFWAVAGGYKPTFLMQKYGDRLYSLHLKEMDARTDVSNPEQYPCAIVGRGISDTAEVIELSKKMGVTDYVVEVEGLPCDLETYLTESYATITDIYFGKN